VAVVLEDVNPLALVPALGDTIYQDLSSRPVVLLCYCCGRPISRVPAQRQEWLFPDARGPNSRGMFEK
jgi:hypothetical protein